MDRIVFLGQRERPEVYSLMKAALFQVLASPAEGHPIAVLEAMAAGTPVIGARVCGTSDVIEDGSNGALFDAGDVEALAHLIRRYAEDEAALDGLRANLSAWDRSTVDIRRLVPEHLRVLAGH